MENEIKYALSKQIPSLHTLQSNYGDLPELTETELAKVQATLKKIFERRLARSNTSDT